MTRPVGPNRYGKSGIRLATVDRSTTPHTFTDLLVEIRLHGDFGAAHEFGDNAAVLPTDTMRGTCFALARDGIDAVPTYGLALARRFLAASAATDRAVISLTQFPWEPVGVDGAPSRHTMRPAAGGTLTWRVALARDDTLDLRGGISGARVLKTTGSAFSGFLRDELTTLGETRDRIMATTVDAVWGLDADVLDDDDPVSHATLAREVPATILAAFARHDDSESVQHTLHAMGNAVLDAHPSLTWIRFLLPNEHHILSDLSPYGLDNPDAVYLVADTPYGVIEGVVAREGVDLTQTTADAPW